MASTARPFHDIIPFGYKPDHCGLQDDGYIAKLLVKAGTKDIKVGEVVGIMVEDKEDVRRFLLVPKI